MSDISKLIESTLSGEFSEQTPKVEWTLDDPALAGLIERVEDLSDKLAHRARISFKNGYQLSVIDFFMERLMCEGLAFLGGHRQRPPEATDNRFEIALITPNDDLDGAVLGFGTVLKHLCADEVRGYIRRAAELPAPSPSAPD